MRNEKYKNSFRKGKFQFTLAFMYCRDIDGALIEGKFWLKTVLFPFFDKIVLQKPKEFIQ